MKKLSVGEMRILAINALYASVAESFTCQSVHIEELEEPRELQTRSIRDAIGCSTSERIGHREMHLASTKDVIARITGKLSLAAMNYAKYFERAAKLQSRITEYTKLELTDLSDLGLQTAEKKYKAKLAYARKLKERLLKAELKREGFRLDAERLETELNDLACKAMKGNSAYHKVLKPKKRKARKSVNSKVVTWQRERVALERAKEIELLASQKGYKVIA